MANKDIKLEAAGSDVKQWQIAKAMGITPQWLCVKLREELPPEEKAKIRAIIAEIRETA